MTRVVMVGQGGHSKVLYDLISLQKDLIFMGFLDDKYDELFEEKGLFYGPIRSAKELLVKYTDLNFIIAIGNNKVRKGITEKLALKNSQYHLLIHPTAVVSGSAVIGEGSVIMANAVVNAESRIGAHTIINTGAIVEHESKLEEFSHISPNATLTGCVHLEEGVHIGAGATIIPNIRIGKWSTIGAGATVIHHIPSYSTAVGVPAKIKWKEGEEVVAVRIQ
ncbi:acetyltransferase [Sutcliffiella rhizosphaerae]|uniref:Acetyltransferase EpsM n=1 Tax=Sutcliffiella rhizosphaerae TaxID=2880967 RepID=A0ABM8YLD5_9BACI|nr:acetyltransferase [Sutcliffiella rhizosphaerae]CAG9620738.1 Putative acetyltransferase EpsM [Sutcliffiella rhizosphaerae]